jgi:hypothetical protein
MAEQRGSAADQVKALVEAAERIRAEAEAEASRTREGVGRVAEHADRLSQRVDELSAGVTEAVAALKSEIEALRASSEASPAAEDPGTRVDPAADDALIAEAEAAAAREPEVEEAPAPEGARLLALKMALDGRPREETAGYLRENFELDDPEGLLDEVYARAGR